MSSVINYNFDEAVRPLSDATRMRVAAILVEMRDTPPRWYHQKCLLTGWVAGVADSHGMATEDLLAQVAPLIGPVPLGILAGQ